MHIRSSSALALCLALAACGGSGSESGEYYAPSEAPQANKFGFQEALSPSIIPNLPGKASADAEGRGLAAVNVELPDNGAQAPIPAGMPQIAYSYDYGFRVDSGKLVAVEQKHADQCTSQGPQVCRLISMNHSGSSGDYARGELRLEVRADLAREFGNKLTGTAESAGGELTSSSVSGEDLSKDIVDTEARLRARTLLRDRLMEVLRSRKGTVADLIKAERGVADVNEEIDQAKSWLAEMKGRVAFSAITIEYQSASPSGGGFWEPIRWAFGAMGATLGRTIATLLLFLTAILPWLLLLAVIVWVWRKSGFRLHPIRWWRARNKDRHEEGSAETAEGEG